MPVALWLSLAGIALLAVLLTAYLVPAIRRFRYRAYGWVERQVFRASDVVFWLFGGLDWLAVFFSRPFLTGHPNGALRWAVFVGWYSALFAVVALAPPWVGVAALGWGISSVLFVHRAWVQNEKRRSKIAKKVDPDEEKEASATDTGHSGPLAAELDRLPDLRREAVFSGLLLLVLMPLLLLTWDRVEPVFDPAPPGLGGALWLIADRTYLKGPLDLLGLEALHTNVALRPDSPAGGLIKVFEKLAYYLIFLGLMRWFHIREDVREGVMGARRDPELAVLLGHRAVRRLEYQIADLRPPDDAPVALLTERTTPLVNSMLALGRLRDRRARGTLARWADAGEYASLLGPLAARQDPALVTAMAYVRAVRVAAVTALGHLASRPPLPPARRPKLNRVKALGGLLRDDRTEAIRETGELVLGLCELLKGDPDEAVRGAAADALGLADHEAAVVGLLARFRQVQTSAAGTGRTVETYPEVIKRLVQSVGERLGTGWSGRTVATPAQRREAVTLILGVKSDAGDERAIPQTAASLLKHRYLRVRNRAGTALASLGDPAALPALLEGLPENDNPKLLVAWLNAVAVLGRVRPTDEDPSEVVAPLTEVIRRERLNNSSVRLAAAEALAALATVNPAAANGTAREALVWALGQAYQQDDKDIQDRLFAILSGTATFRAGSLAAVVKERWSFDFLADQVEIVVDATRSDADRLTAAERIRPLNDEGSLGRLIRLLDWPAGTPDPLPEGLRAKLRPKVLEMEVAVEGPAPSWGEMQAAEMGNPPRP